jgi:hypothetical protein
MTSYQKIQPPQSESDSDLQLLSLIGLAQLVPAMYGSDEERATYRADGDPALRAYSMIHAQSKNLPRPSPLLDQALSKAFASLTPEAQLRFKQDDEAAGENDEAARS